MIQPKELEYALTFWSTVLIWDEFGALKYVANKWNLYQMVLKKKGLSKLCKIQQDK